MEREIKFRAWFKPLKRMYLVRELKFGRNNKITVITNHTGGTAPISYEIMQFTGLKDKNNKDIYEGDILTYGLKKDEIIIQIIWNDLDDNGFKVISQKDKNCLHDIRIYRFEEQSEVIGNIYENPELLKEDVDLNQIQTNDKNNN